MTEIPKDDGPPSANELANAAVVAALDRLTEVIRQQHPDTRPAATALAVAQEALDKKKLVLGFFLGIAVAALGFGVWRWRR